MMHSILDITEYYEQAEKCFSENNPKLAAFYYKKCWDSYNESEDIMILPSVSHLAHDAFDKHNLIVKEHLDESGFDLIEYEV